MKNNICSSTKTMKLSCFFSFCMAAMSLAIIANPISAYSADKLMVEDSGGNIKFSARDDGSIMLNSNTFDGPSWAVIYGASDNNNTGLALDSYGSTAALGGGGNFRFARGTHASKAAVQTGDRLGFFVFSGYDGTNFLNTAGLTAKVDGAVSTGSVPAKLVFETLSTGSPRLERMVISSSGYVGIGGDTGSGIPSPSYPLQMGSGAFVTTGGVWTNASSRAYKENIKTLTGEEANQVLDRLSPVKYNYKTDKEDKHVGFIAEDVPDLVATKDRKGLSPMDIVAVLTKVVQEEKNTIAEQMNMISELSKKVDAMQQEINRVKGMNLVGSVK
ncbi:MAG: tail fiber domain-containing protein [Nitrospirae bacterium]|nr:tail fiber domain-containing protein [Nitrospirota bacterium]